MISLLPGQNERRAGSSLCVLRHDISVCFGTEVLLQILLGSKGYVTDIASERSLVVVGQTHVSNHVFLLAETRSTLLTGEWFPPFMYGCNVLRQILEKKERRVAPFAGKRPIFLMHAGDMLLQVELSGEGDLTLFTSETVGLVVRIQHVVSELGPCWKGVAAVLTDDALVLHTRHLHIGPAVQP
mmetsp:Transcript_5642/g.16784  ORF Transcript_5642/g.16784 Transcript_5642/m.16784 type:complete len:184 (+) Transcript_5642:60-611(+)